MVKKRSKRKGLSKKDDQKLFAFLATFLSILGFLIALAVKKNDKYVMFYAKQSLIIFIAYIIAGIAVVVPFIGIVISPILYLITFVLWVFSWIYALSGKTKETPIIGEYANRINL